MDPTTTRGTRMRHRTLAAALGGLLATGGLATVGGSAAPAAPAAALAPLNECVNPDNGDPVMTSVDLSTTSVDVADGPARVTITAAVEDTGGPGAASGLRPFRVTVSSAEGSEHPVRMAPTAAGEWAGTLRIPRWSRPGRWHVERVLLRDRAGHSTDYRRGDDSGLPFASLLPVAGNHSVAVASVSDTTPPTVTSFRLARDSADTTRRARRVQVTARAHDPQSGVSRVGAVLVEPRGGHHYSLVWLHLQPGTGRAWRGRLEIHRWVRSGTWRIETLVAFNGNERHIGYGYRALGALGFSRDLQVTSRLDPSAPTISSFDRSPAAVDISREDGRLAVTSRVVDVGSGVGSVTSVLLGPGHAHVGMALHLVSGTRHDGLWRGDVALPTCTIPGGDRTAWIIVRDRAGHRTVGTPRWLARHGWPATLHVTGRPHLTPPRPHVPDRVPATGRVVVTFPRAVNGISTASATVRTGYLDSPAPDGPVLTGAWTCRDRDGVVTDCATGRVRRADFLPAAPFTPGQWYLVELDPEHTLELTDLWGNPYDRDLFAFVATSSS